MMPVRRVLNVVITAESADPGCSPVDGSVMPFKLIAVTVSGFIASPVTVHVKSTELLKDDDNPVTVTV